MTIHLAAMLKTPFIFVLTISIMPFFVLFLELTIITLIIASSVDIMAVPLLTKKIVKKRVKKFKRPQSDRKISVKVIFLILFNIKQLFYAMITCIFSLWCYLVEIVL